MAHPATYRDTDKITRPDLLQSYLANVGTYLTVANKHLNGSFTKQDVVRFVNHVVEKTMKRPKVKCVVHKKYGDAEAAELDLYEHTQNIKDRIILPFGSVYKPATEIVSFLKDQITEQKARRKSSKALMLKYKAEGNTTLANYYNSDQALQKISMNSIPGAMGSKYSFISDIAGFNSITSTGRYFIMSSYANCERLLEGNFYFPNIETVWNYLVLMARICPPKMAVDNAIDNLGLKHADVDDVLGFLEENYSKYNSDPLPVWVYQWLCNCSGKLLDYIYYCNNLKNIMQSNTESWMNWISNFYDISKIDFNQEVSPKELFKIDGDLVIVLSTIFSEWLPIEDGKKVNIYDTVEKHPELAKRFVCVGKSMSDKLANIDKSMKLFLEHKTVISNVVNHKYMYRNCVIGSDTDSIIFTTKNWLQWYNGDLRINERAYQVNCLVVYWLSKSNTYLMDTISHHKGALGEDIKGIAMKNEFYYPVMTLSNLKKHYAGMYTIQEGVILPKMKSDIKGVQFKGSKLCNETLEFVKGFIDGTHETIVKDGQISATDCISKVIAFEKQVYDSLTSGETKYLPIQPVKNENDYKDSDISLYFNYKIWESVFAEKYGNIEIPTKCYIVPLTDLTNPKYLEWLKGKDKDIHDKLVKTLEGIKKDVSRIPINPFLDNVPEELIPIIATNQIVADNCSPLYLFMKSLGVSLGANNKTKFLFSEVYGM